MNDDYDSLDEDAPEPAERSTVVRVAWILTRLLMVVLGGLVVAHWMRGLWANGWFQLAAALVLCCGLPVTFYQLIRRKVAAAGGKARFGVLTLATMVSLPVLLWVGVKEPGTYVDAIGDEGMGGLRWIAARVGGHADVVAVGPDDPADTSTAAAVQTGTPTPHTPALDGAEAEPTEPAEPVEVRPAAVPPGGTPLPFESLGGQMLIEASMGEGHPLPFILDTGASYSTLNGAALATLGLEIPADAPVKRMQTAGGQAEGRLVLVDAVTVGGQRREGVVFWICEPCAVGDAVGLMGLNVWQGYLLTIDPLEQTVFLQPREGQTSRTLDVEPYLDIRAVSSRVGDGELIVDLELTNRAARPVRQAVVLVTALDGRDREVGAFTVDAGEIAATATQATTGSMPQAIEVASVRLELLDAWW